MVNVERAYDQLANGYDELYIDPDSEYMQDEAAATWAFRGMKYRASNIISLGCGTGQDVAITNADPDKFVGFDVSEGMLAKARVKYPRHHFVRLDCNYVVRLLPDDGSILVSIFGTPNYLGADKLLEHYKASNCAHAFFIFYDHTYDDGVVSNYHKYRHEDLVTHFGAYTPVIRPLRANYRVVAW
jgi:predicted TPR repeat methyltransferase